MKQVFFKQAAALAVVLLLIAGFPPPCAAESLENSRPRIFEIPNGQASFAESREGGFYITKANLAQFDSVLLPPISGLIRDGRFALRVARSLNFGWDVGAAWTQGARSNRERFQLDAKYNLVRVGDSPAVHSLPFGTAEQINQEADAVKRAYQILWNLVFSELTYRDILYNIGLEWIGTQDLLREGSASFYRRLVFEAPPPAAPDPAIETRSLLRQDFLRLLEPQSTSGLTWMDWRYNSEHDDALWIYSPVLKSLRQVFESNRSDPLLGGLLTLEDFFVWSGKVPSVEAKVIDERILLVPFPSLSFYHASKELTSSTDGEKAGSSPGSDVLAVRGTNQKSDGTTGFVTWNYENRLFPQSAPWIPSSASFVPRKVWLIELSPLDPFDLEGRQLLVVDEELMLPVYRVVHDRKGGFSRITMGGWGLGQTDGQAANLPFLAFLLSADQSMRKVTAASTRFVRSFRGEQSAAAKEIQRLLDPTTYPGMQKEGENKLPAAGAPAAKEGEAAKGAEPAKPAETPKPAQPAPGKTSEAPVGTED